MQVNSRIEEKIEDIYAFIEDCKMKAFSNTQVVVPKNELYDMLDELRRDVPDEVRRYQKMLDQRNDILNDAENKAQALLLDANEQFNAMISEHNVTLAANAQAEEIVAQAQAQAEAIINSANVEADEIVKGAMYYTSDMMAKTEMTLSRAYESTVNNAKALEVALGGHLDIVRKDKAALMASLNGENVSVNSDNSANDVSDDSQEDEMR